MSWAMMEKGYSQRRACGLARIDPSVYRYKSSRSDDEDLRRRLRELASERRRFGYRRLHTLLKREGIEVNRKKVYRLYKEEGLTVRKRGGRKRALGTRAPMAIPQEPNQRWSLDFVSDSLTDGRRLALNTFRLSAEKQAKPSITLLYDKKSGSRLLTWEERSSTAAQGVAPGRVGLGGWPTSFLSRRMVACYRSTEFIVHSEFYQCPPKMMTPWRT